MTSPLVRFLRLCFGSAHAGFAIYLGAKYGVETAAWSVGCTVFFLGWAFLPDGKS